MVNFSSPFCLLFLSPFCHFALKWPKSEEKIKFKGRLSFIIGIRHPTEKTLVASCPPTIGGSMGCQRGQSQDSGGDKIWPPFKKNSSRFFFWKSYLERCKIKWPKSDEKTELGLGKVSTSGSIPQRFFWPLLPPPPFHNGLIRPCPKL